MSVTLSEAQTDLVKLIHGLPPGGQLVVTENGRPVATITAVGPAPAGKRVPGLWKGKLTYCPVIETLTPTTGGLSPLAARKP